jgi:hypothetical protein
MQTCLGAWEVYGPRSFTILSPITVANVAKIPYKYLILLNGGEGGIRTPDTVARMPHFECGAFDHSATSPN